MKATNIIYSKAIDPSKSFGQKDPNSDKARNFARIILDLCQNLENDQDYKISICDGPSFILRCYWICEEKRAFLISEGCVFVRFYPIVASHVPKNWTVPEYEYYFSICNVPIWNMIVDSVKIEP